MPERQIPGYRKASPIALKREATAACGAPAEAQPVARAADAGTADASAAASRSEAFTTIGRAPGRPGCARRRGAPRSGAGGSWC